MLQGCQGVALGIAQAGEVLQVQQRLAGSLGQCAVGGEGEAVHQHLCLQAAAARGAAVAGPVEVWMKP